MSPLHAPYEGSPARCEPDAICTPHALNALLELSLSKQACQSVVIELVEMPAFRCPIAFRQAQGTVRTPR